MSELEFNSIVGNDTEFTELSRSAEETEEAGTQNDGFTVVGVGASAGGLEAFSEFLQFLPHDTGMAFVLVQHLDPRHPSILAELLAHQTAMVVAQVQDGTRVEPNRIYVIPPNTAMVIEDRTLKLTPRSMDSKQHRPIDVFFTALASDLRSGAIGVVLSGTASDGTLGLKAIKAEGGITFAQDLSARFDSMPRNAIAAGVVDFILSPRQIAEEVAAIATHPYRRGSGQKDLIQQSPAMHRIMMLMRSHMGVDFTQYKQPTIVRRLGRRMVLRKTETIDQYLETLQQDPDEMRSLFDDLLINVTEFFRDADVFESIKQKALPRILQELRAGDTVRVWVPGCATGEEVYSLAIALAEYLEEHDLNRSVQIFGTDVSDAVIERARAGIYDQNTVAALSPERLRRFFNRVNGGYQISHNIREQCIFSRHNIAKDPPLSRMHLISCRNLLIYFEPPLQRRVLATFGYALLPKGCLILGSSETLGSIAGVFEVTDQERKIFAKKEGVPHSALNLSERISGTVQQSADQVRFAPRAESRQFAVTLQKYADQVLLTQFVPSSVVIDHKFRILQIRGEARKFFVSGAPDSESDLLVAVGVHLSPALVRAVDGVRKTNVAVQLDPLPMGHDSPPVRITVAPVFTPASEGHYVVVFEVFRPLDAGTIQSTVTNGDDAQALYTATAEGARHVAHLERELTSTREYLQSIIEELRSTNEEAQSANEELQSTNEELQTAKEELQSTNEELNTINTEMQGRNSELSQANDDLLNLLSSMNMPVVMLGADLRIRRFTPLSERVLHLIATDAGRPISDINHRLGISNLDQILQNVLDTLVSHEQEVQDQDGHWYTMRIRPYRTAKNRIEGAVLQLYDITELKRSIDDIRHARDYSQAIVDTVRAPLVVLDQEMCIRNGNRAFYDFFATTAPEAVTKSIYEVAQGALVSERIRDLLAHLSTGDASVKDLEAVFNQPGAGPRNMLLNGRRLTTFGNTGLTLVAFEDITERKRAAEARYRRLFEAARDGIIILDAASGEITDINPFIEQLSGYSRDLVVGHKLWETPFLDDPDNLRGAIDEIRDQGVVRFPEFIIHARDGSKLQTEVIANIYSEVEGRSIQLNVRDLTERKKFERELQHTQKLESLGLLAGGIAHDFNNLLTGILGNASLALSDLETGGPIRKYMREIISASERAAFLTGQMLAYAGKGRFVNRLIDLGEAVREISALITTSIPKTVEVGLDLPQNLPPIEADPGQIQQLVMNLVINGAEAIPENQAGRVDVRTSLRELTEEDVRVTYAADQIPAGRYISMEVKDSGVGLDDATRARIFDPFFTTKFTGRGLGLAAVLGIVKSHRGAIRVYSRPGHGTSFQVLLPASIKTLRAADPAKTAQVPRRKATILVIDDEEMIRDLADAILSDQGFDVLTAADGHRGIQMLREHKESIDLVVLDLLMPVMGGEETLDLLHRISPDLPIILSSGFDESEAEYRLKGQKLAAFLKKPYGSDTLVQAVDKALAGKPE